MPVRAQLAPKSFHYGSCADDYYKIVTWLGWTLGYELTTALFDIPCEDIADKDVSEALATPERIEKAQAAVKRSRERAEELREEGFGEFKTDGRFEIFRVDFKDFSRGRDFWSYAEYVVIFGSHKNQFTAEWEPAHYTDIIDASQDIKYGPEDGYNSAPAFRRWNRLFNHIDFTSIRQRVQLNR